MKELTIYPPIHEDDDPHAYAFIAAAKHFTDAELAAEYWAPNWLTMPDADWDGDYQGTSIEMRHRMATLHRFATHPHALEDS